MLLCWWDGMLINNQNNNINNDENINYSSSIKPLGAHVADGGRRRADEDDALRMNEAKGELFQ